MYENDALDFVPIPKYVRPTTDLIAAIPPTTGRGFLRIHFGSLPPASEHEREDPYLVVLDYEDDEDECEDCEEYEVIDLEVIEVEAPEMDEETRERVCAWMEGLCSNQDVLELDSTLSDDRKLSLGIRQSEASNVELLQEAIRVSPLPLRVERPPSP